MSKQEYEVLTPLTAQEIKAGRTVEHLELLTKLTGAVFPVSGDHLTVGPDHVASL